MAACMNLRFQDLVQKIFFGLLCYLNIILRSNTGITLSRINDGLKVSNVDETSNYVRSLEVGNDGIFFYGTPHEKHEVLFAFCKPGWRKVKVLSVSQDRKPLRKSVGTWKTLD